MIYSWKFYVIKYIYCGFIDVLLEGVANISAVAVTMSYVSHFYGFSSDIISTYKSMRYDSIR